LKQVPGVAPEEALADAREFLENEFSLLCAQPQAMTDEQLYEHFLSVYGAPAQLAAGYGEAATPVRERSGYAPNWRICCTHCGRSAPAAKAGIIRIGARSWHKYVLGWCRECRRPRFLRLVRDMEQPTLTGRLGADRTPEQVRRAMHWPRATIVGCIIAALVVPWLVRGATALLGNRPNPMFANLPAGWRVERSTDLSAQQREAIGRKLGGKIVHLNNTVLSADGRQLQVNTLEAAADVDAKQIERSLRAVHPDPRFVGRHGKQVFELSGKDTRLAMDARYRLGIQPKRVTYRVSFDAAPLVSGDYTVWNRLFNVFAAGAGQPDEAQVAELAKQLQFGSKLSLRQYGLGATPSRYTLQPPADGPAVRDGIQTYAFDKLPRKAGLPYVSVSAEITSETYAATPSERRKGPELLRATPHWPVDQPKVVELARQITQHASNDAERVRAVLDWLVPGKNLRRGGAERGTRHGVEKVLQQGFGHCWDFSDCFVTLCRAAGVPCRQVAGWMSGSEGHVWAEVLVEGHGWVEVDPSDGLACGSDYVPYLTSEDGEMPLVYVSPVRLEVVGAP
jgi:hypothetical protein